MAHFFRCAASQGGPFIAKGRGRPKKGWIFSIFHCCSYLRCTYWEHDCLYVESKPLAPNEAHSLLLGDVQRLEHAVAHLRPTPIHAAYTHKPELAWLVFTRAEHPHSSETWPRRSTLLEDSGPPVGPAAAASAPSSCSASSASSPSPARSRHRSHLCLTGCMLRRH